MEILPDTTVADITAVLAPIIGNNVVVIVGVIALGVAIAFIVRWFHKGTRRIKA